MRKNALIIGMIGLGLLVSLLVKEPQKITSLDGLTVGSVVEIEGTVAEERKYGDGKLLIIDEMPIYCECSQIYSGSKVIVEGIVEKFPNELRIKAFRIHKLL